ncbi:hypothetical protein QOT17_014553 [Balamuthia mandrillaris]
MRRAELSIEPEQWTVIEADLFAEDQQKFKMRKRAVLFLTLMILEGVIVVGFSIYQMATSKETSLGSGVIFLLISLFIVYFGFDGVLNENKFELFSFTAASFLFLLYGLNQVFSPDIHRTIVFWVRFGCIAVMVPTNLALSFAVYRSFGWVIYRRIGADPTLQAMFKVFQVWTTLLKVDVFLGVIGVLMIGLFLFGGYELYIDIGFVVMTVLWAVACWFAAKQEVRWMMIAFFVFALVEPCYIVTKVIIVVVLKPSEYESLELIGPVVVGVLALIVRVLLVVTGILVFRNFGKGLRQIQ